MALDLLAVGNMNVWPASWSEILLPQAPILESVARITIVYLSLFALLRIVLKREASGVAISDVLVIVLLADAVQNGMAGDYTSVGDALVLGTTLILWDWLLDYMAFHFAWFARLVRPKPLPIIRDGRIIAAHARRELLTRQEIEERLLAQGMDSVSEVKVAYVQSNGQISAIRKGDGEVNRSQQEPPTTGTENP
jgi:uncharacterized membrane protein YcaP (DUF421 family)